jgi:hypothetical protein
MAQSLSQELARTLNNQAGIAFAHRWTSKVHALKVEQLLQERFYWIVLLQP